MYHFSEKYGYSNGKMYIALVDEKLAGCVALTKNDDDYCEIKRLYIREEFRGNHLGNMLSEKIIEDAGAIGYKYMRLDTVPFMSSAIKIYEKVGFKFIEKYNVNPASNAIFMQLDCTCQQKLDTKLKKSGIKNESMYKIHQLF